MLQVSDLFISSSFKKSDAFYLSCAADNPFTSLPPALLLRLKGHESGGIQFTFETTLPGMWGHASSVPGQEQAAWVGVGGGVLGLRELLMSQTYAGQQFCSLFCSVNGMLPCGYSLTRQMLTY